MAVSGGQTAATLGETTGRRVQLFPGADSPCHVFDRIARGDVFYYELTVPEGSNFSISPLTWIALVF